MLAISVPAFIFADSWGRRTSTITGGIGLSGCMFVIGTLYATDSVHAHSGSGRWFVILLVFVFALTYCATWGIVGKIYASEIQPVQTRAAANSVAQGLNFVSLIQSLAIYMLIYAVHKLACGLCHSHLPCPLLFWRIFSFRWTISFHPHRARALHARNTRTGVRRNPRRITQANSEPSSSRPQDVRWRKVQRKSEHSKHRSEHFHVRRDFPDGHRKQPFNHYTSEDCHEYCVRENLVISVPIYEPMQTS